MKHLLIILLFISFKTNGFAQCSVDLGPDTTYCDNFAEPKILGGAGVAVGGVAPFTYAWSCNYMPLGTLYTASDFLDDTTFAAPTFISLSEGSLPFVLSVTDAMGATCSDTIVVSFFPFYHTLETKTAYISTEDTISIYWGVAGGTLPYSFLWTPDYEISDPTAAQPLVSPDVNTNYTVTIPDANGCVTSDIYYVYVHPVAIHNLIQEKNISITPNPITAQAIISLPISLNNYYIIQIFNATGQFIKEIESSNHKIEIAANEFQNGVYYLYYKDATNRRYTAPFVVMNN